ncbi:MAG: hypothetical protein ABII82_15325 [Verrucomicrobiota bacterium]
MLKPALASAWSLYRQNFGLIAAIVLIVWLPIEVVYAYCEYEVFDPENLKGPFRLGQLLENVVGIIGIAALTRLTLTAGSGQKATLAESMGAALQSWGRLFWTRLLSGLVIVFTLLLLIVPGIYFATRFCFAECAVVGEGVSGTRALQRSHELTRGRFWPVLGFNALLLTGAGIVMCIVILPVVFVPALDNWPVSAGFMLVADLLMAFLTVAYTHYYALLIEVTPADELPAPTLS